MIETPFKSVTLRVKNFMKTLTFYRDVLGFTLHQHDPHHARLGTESQTLLHLRKSWVEKPSPGTTGLYHLAVLLPERLHLAQLLSHMADMGTPLHGFADHGVSNAIYLQDPDGNGVELYWDRPQKDWPKHNGQLQMTTRPLDTQLLYRLAENARKPWQGLPSRTRLGHVHLRVNAIEPAESFYQDILGMDLMQRYGSAASFLSYYGYHHHIGVNTWNSKGAPPPQPDTPGLGWITLKYHPDMNLDSSGTISPPPGIDDPGRWVEDPAGNRFLIQENHA